jgi:hypothetical protein
MIASTPRRLFPVAMAMRQPRAFSPFNSSAAPGYSGSTNPGSRRRAWKLDL